MADVSRRVFLERTTAASVAAAAATTLVAAPARAAAAAAADVPTIAIVGCGGMGMNHVAELSARKDVRIAYVCDVDSSRLAAAIARVEKGGQAAPKGVKDLREVRDDKSVDAVWIATPDHWHVPAALLMVEAGKHVYVEKPCSHNVREGKLLLEAARKHNRVVQVGTQARSTKHVAEAMQKLRDGVIGDVLVAKAWNSQKRGSIGKQQPSSPPANLDFDLWLGPAPERQYQSNLLHSIWRWWHAFGCGDIGNDGIHEIDVARWGLGVDMHPTSVAGLGSKCFFDDDQQFPDTQYVAFEWPGNGQPGQRRQLVFEQRIWSPYVQEGYENGNAFYGTKGMMLLGKGSGYQIFGARNAAGEKGSGAIDLVAHHQNFLDCVRSGERPAADIEEGHRSATLAHLANIACRTGRSLTFDPQTEQVVGDDEAGKLLGRDYREGHWAAPKLG